MDDSELPADGQPEISWIKVELTATREFEIPIENGLLLPPDAVRNMILNDLPHRMLALSSLRVASIPECYENGGDFQVGLELATDELKANVAYRMITDKVAPAAAHEPVPDTDVDDLPNASDPANAQATIDKLRQIHAAQIAAGSKGQHNTRAHRRAARNTAKKLQEAMRTNNLESNINPFKSNIASTRVRKPHVKRQRQGKQRRQAQHEEQGEQEEQVKQERKRAPRKPPGNAMAVHIQSLQNFTQRMGKDGITAQLETFGRNEDSKTKERLERAAERRWKGEESELTEDKKLDLIAAQLEKMFEAGNKRADKETSANDKQGDDMKE